MKGDLVERLSTWSETPFEGDPMVDVLLTDAADALEEITRLRAALTTIHAMSLKPSGHEPNARRQMGEIAMKALEGGHE